MNLYGITISTDIISKEQIEIAHAKNLRVAIWGLYTENDNIEGIRKNPDYMQTDKVEDLLDLLE